MKVAVSILSTKNSKERELVVENLNKSNADYIHFDVMDAKFVPNKSLCIPELVKLIKKSKKKNDVHLMVEDPMKYIDQIKKLDVGEKLPIYIVKNGEEEVGRLVGEKGSKDIEEFLSESGIL